ncbi:MAG: YCF48-related protein [Terracidiphilus sp.]
MNTKIRHTLRFLLLSTAFAVISTQFAQAVPPDGWYAVDTGFATQVLLGHSTAMWAAGSGESIAVSTDAGQHWQRKHQDPKGALLLVLNFVDDKFGYAAGTGGKMLFTEDGGESWNAQKLSDETILQAAFGDEQHGVIRTLSALLATTDGGKTWRPIVPSSDPDWVKHFPNTVEMVALDKNHLVVRISEGPVSDGEFLSTSDGGVTWSANYIPSSGIPGVFAAGGSYWSVGHEVLGKDKPGGGYASPMSFHSKDGITWEHTPINHDVCHWHDCGGCTSQGCFAGKSSFLQFLDGKDWLAKFPAHEGLSSQWAKSNDTLCLLSHTSVQCTKLQPVQKLDTQEDSPSWEDRSIPAIGRVVKSNPQCIRCHLNPMFITDTGNSGPLDVQISFVIERSGQVDQVAILGNLPDDVIQKIREAVTGWFFEPMLKDGVPTATTFGMKGRIMILNPDKPQNHPK